MNTITETMVAGSRGKGWHGDSEGHAVAGQKGSASLKERLGSDEAVQDYFRRMGRKGGRKLAVERGPDYFAEIGRKGAASRHAQEG